MLQKVKSALHKDLVLYNEDHHPNHVVCFCPRFFLRGLCATWDDPSVFKSLQGSPEEWQQKMLDRPDSFAPFQTVFLDFFQECEIASGHSVSKTQETVHQGANDHLLFGVFLELASVALTLIAKALCSDSRACKACPN